MELALALAVLGESPVPARTHTTNAREDRQNFTSRDTVQPRSPPGQRSRQMLKKKKRGQRKTRLPGGMPGKWVQKTVTYFGRQSFQKGNRSLLRLYRIGGWLCILDNIDLGE